MRALFLIPGDSSRQLQAFAAVAAVADQLGAEVQVRRPDVFHSPDFIPPAFGARRRVTRGSPNPT